MGCAAKPGLIIKVIRSEWKLISSRQSEFAIIADCRSSADDFGMAVHLYTTGVPRLASPRHMVQGIVTGATVTVLKQVSECPQYA